MLFCENHDLVWKQISVSEKRMKNCIWKIIDNVFEKMTKVGYFLKGQSFGNCLDWLKTEGELKYYFLFFIIDYCPFK